MTKSGKFGTILKVFATLAQSVARILGKDEVGGSSPLGSSDKRKNKGFSRYDLGKSLFRYRTNSDEIPA